MSQVHFLVKNLLHQTCDLLCFLFQHSLAEYGLFIIYANTNFQQGGKEFYTKKRYWYNKNTNIL